MLKDFLFDYGEFSHSYLSLPIAVKCGANPLTMSGLSGIGDLILTCTGDLSRCVILHANENVDFFDSSTRTCYLFSPGIETSVFESVKVKSSIISQRVCLPSLKES